MELREIRFKRRITQYELQRESGIDQSRISIIERGVLPAKRNEKFKIATALKLQVEDIDWPEPARSMGEN